MRKILITGATGFVGSNLVSYIKRDNDIICPGRHQLMAELPGNHTVIHLAGKAHDLKNASGPEEYYKVNYELTKKLYDDFLRSDSKKFIFISSVKAAADVVPQTLYEDSPPDPKTDYGKSKLMAEEYIRSQVLPDGKSYYILRPCMIHGPGNKGNLNLLYQFVSIGLPYPLASFVNKRSYLSIENLCFVIKEIVERDDVPSGIYNLADDEALSTTEVVQLLAQAKQKQPRLLYISKKAISIVAKIGDLIRLPLNSERLQKLTESYVVSNQKIRNVLGNDLPVSSREGFLLTAKSFEA